MSESAVRHYDVVTWGETMVRLSAPRGEPLEATPVLEVAVGGTESNVAIALARLGRRASWVSRLPANALGRRIAREIAAHGVDTSHVLWAGSAEKAGLYFIEPGAAPRPNRVLYERRDSAVARLHPDALDYAHLASGHLLHLTGVTPALSEGCHRAWLASIQAARAAGARVSLDVNYRAKLWSAVEARETLEAVLGQVDVLFSGLADLCSLFGLPTEPEAAVRAFAANHRVPLVVVTLGEQGALALSRARGGEALLHAPIVPTDVQDRIGAGDAFAAGFLHGWLARGVAHGLRCGNALAALKQTWRGDASWATHEELDELVQGGAGDPRRVSR